MKQFLQKKLYISLITLLLLACGKKENLSPIGDNSDFSSPEKIQFSVKYDRSLALKDIVEGSSDIFLDNVPFGMVNNLSDNEKKNLDIYPIPSDSWTFVLNPYPNQAPYQVKLGNSTEFNPFAIREVRYALNFLMDRNYIADEILGGAGMPALTPVTPDSPNAWKFELQANKLGLSVNGDKDKAISDINSAMEKASKLPENKNRLVKKDKFWYFDEKPISIKFVIRVDDPEGRLKLGNYFAKLMEETGIHVEKLLWDGNKSNEVVYATDPASLQWQIYTETWGGGSTYIWQDIPIIQYQTSIWGNQPGWGESSWWNYKNEESDKLAQKWYSGKIATVDEHWKDMLKMNEIGLKEAVRLYISYQMNYYVANKNSLKERLFYNYATGLSKDALLNAKTKDGILKVLQFSSLGGLYQSPWDPIGARGFMDIYSSNLVQLIFDRELVDGPFGQMNTKRITVVSTKSDPIFEKDKDGNISKISGNIKVDKNAVIFDPETKKYKNVGENVKAVVETTFGITKGSWHHGREIKTSDYLYAPAFITEWSYEDGQNDKKFDSSYSAYWKPQLANAIGTRYNKDGTITTWSNSFSPKGGLSNLGEIPTLRVNGNQLPGYAMPWEIIEAIQSIVVDGAESKTVYGLSEKDGIEAIDLKSPKFTKDLRAKLKEFIDKKYVPEVLKTSVKPEEALENYNLTIKFIDTYGHGLIGWGPYMLTKLDIKNGYAELSKFHDKYQRDEGDKWTKLYRISRLRVDNLDMPDTVLSGENFEIKGNISEIQYPTEEVKKATKGSVYALLINEKGEMKIDGKLESNGTFVVSLNKEKTKLLKGNYTVIILASLDGEFTDTKVTNILFE